MPTDLQQLVRETIDLTGVEPPSLLDEHAVALRTDTATPFYLVGLIGGKEVGKSSLVNALAGREIAPVTSFGEGTARVTAYVHRDVAEPLRELLERDVPGQYTIIVHEQPTLRRQVLLDLPDIDSRFQSHLALTRTMLRRMLYPVWVQSIEKYADLQPQKMLKEVAEGNSPENFLFCLSKADQLREPDAAEALRHDFGDRIARTLSLPSFPTVYLISARAVDRFDLQALKDKLSRERSERDVAKSVGHAQDQQEHTLTTWITKQDLPARAHRAQRLEEDARTLLSDRVGEPLLEKIVPQIAADPIQRAGIVQEVFDRRIDRWPIVRLMNLVLSPLVNLGETIVRGRSAGSGQPVDRAEQIEPIVRPLAKDLQAAMAHLRQSQPAVAAIYEHDRLWEEMNAELAVGRLRDRLAAAVSQQRVDATKHLSSNWPLSGIGRWLVTVGAALWFPLVQPVLSIALKENAVPQAMEIARLFVDLLSGQKLLQDVAFLVIWYVLLWLAVRYRTYRQVKAWLAASDAGPLDLTSVAVAWMDELLDPIARQHKRLASLVERVGSRRS